jgi:FdhD protein
MLDGGCKTFTCVHGYHPAVSRTGAPDPLPDHLPDGAAPRILQDGRSDALVREEPLLLVIHGQQLLTMRTPGRDEDLALGFLLGEGIVRAVADVRELRALPGDPEAVRADELHVTLAAPPDSRVQGLLRRTHEIRSSCGVCGLADPGQILEGTPPLLPGVPRVARASLPRLQQRLQEHQELFTATGGCHGAVVVNTDGEVWGAGEDVGRHNALDKAIGQAARAGRDLTRGVALLSGRAGYDLVIKCLRVRIPVIASVSAASALAFDLCSAAGATLVGFLRGEHCTVYCDGGRRLA